jgi:hypothetical protein
VRVSHPRSRSATAKSLRFPETTVPAPYAGLTGDAARTPEALEKGILAPRLEPALDAPASE